MPDPDLKLKWRRTLTASGRMVKRPSDDRGYCRSRREAAAKVEAAWFKAVDDIAMDAPEGLIR